MPPKSFRWAPFLLVTLVALGLRTWDLAARPMHADEANQAVKAGALLEAGRYTFDPHDHHGPVLYYATLPLAWVRGQHTLAELDETTVRLVTALAGTVSVLLLGLFALPLGRGTALLASAFLAVSPPAVYYSRYFVHETLLATFFLAALCAAQRWWRTGRLHWAVTTGIAFGLMQATKASAPLFALVALIALVATRSGLTSLPAGKQTRAIIAAALAALFVVVIFYSSFGTNLGGLGDALGTYGSTAARLSAGGTGHEKPWWYYLELFALQRNGGLLFEQATFAVLALAGVVVAFTGRNPWLRAAAVYTLLLLLALSLPAYKTPWHVIHLIPGLALLAAGALAAISEVRWGLPLAVIAAALALGSLWFQTGRVTRAYPADARNPYAYVHSSPDVRKFRALAESARRAAPSAPIRVISEEYWPLPWYFRGLDGVGYWTSPPDDCTGALVIASAGLAEAVRAKLPAGYTESYLGLRPGFVCVVFTPAP
jgi:uncharacterized protein (TIGR03663 family)